MSEGVVFGAAPAGMAAKMGAGACADVEAETGAGVGVGVGVEAGADVGAGLLSTRVEDRARKVLAELDGVRVDKLPVLLEAEKLPTRC